MADLKKINAEYIKHLEEEKVKLNEDVYNDLKNGIGTDLCHKNLDFLIRAIKLEFHSIENEYILLIHDILKSENISNNNANQILQEIQSRTNQNKESLNYYLTKLDDLIKLLQSNINVAPKYQKHIQGKIQKTLPERERAIEYAKKLWEENPDLTKVKILEKIKKEIVITKTDDYIKRSWLKGLKPKK